MAAELMGPRADVAPRLQDALTALSDAGGALREVVEEYDAWMRAKPAAKVDAIKRIMGTVNELTGKPHSCSSAEAVVETDETYRAFLTRGTTLTLLKMQFETAYTIAMLRAEHLARYI